MLICLCMQLAEATARAAEFENSVSELNQRIFSITNDSDSVELELRV